MFVLVLNIVATVKQDFIILSIVTFAVLNISYFTSIRLMLYRFRTKYEKSPVPNGMFRMYSKNLISNSPSKKEKKYYITSNKVTMAFNTLILFTVFLFILACFMR